MSAVPSAFILGPVEVEVEVEVDVLDLVMPDGVVIVLDLLVVAALLVIVLDLVMPDGVVIVLDLVVVAAAPAAAPGLVVTFMAGAWVVRVAVIFDTLALVLEVLAGGVAAGVWARATEPPKKLSETRKLRMRFIKMILRVNTVHLRSPKRRIMPTM